ncbi:MAG: ABC transporter ATP-binding protein [Conexibacteraceae bacterium]|nr:ABC transporter ATP-binding protein [Conexibacteraceae bacterium]
MNAQPGTTAVRADGSADSQEHDGLVVADVTVQRAGFDIVRQASLVAPVGRVTVVLGANGAGKTTLLEAISGVIPAASGTIELNGKNLRSLGRRRRALLGLGHIEQGRRIFGELTTQENILCAAPRDYDVSEAFALFPELEPRRNVRAVMLSGGEQQMLVIARALAVRPQILMVDEMSLGLAPLIATRLITLMRTLADERGVGVLLVEQFASLALAAGDHAYVLGDNGRIVYDGSCQTLIDSPDILRRAYLGEEVSPPS